MDLRIGHLYADLMNIYGDRGNVLVLQQRCRWRGIEPIVETLGLGARLDPDRYDLLFVGGGQDRDQQLMGRDLREVKGPAVLAAANRGVVVLSVCGGYQLLGTYYRAADGTEVRGLGLFDARTEHPGAHVPRCTGNVLVRCDWDPQRRTLVGFENHGGRTYLGPGARPLGTVVHGFGNNASDGTEGVAQGNLFGTYLHGSLLPKNPWFADHLIALALRRRYGADVSLPPLDDSLETTAHRVMVRRMMAGGQRFRSPRELPAARARP